MQSALSRTFSHLPKTLSLCPFTLLWCWQAAAVKTVSLSAWVCVFECLGKQRWFGVYSFSMARGERWGQVTPHPPLHLFLSPLVSLTLTQQIRNQRKGNVRDERAKGVTNSGEWHQRKVTALHRNNTVMITLNEESGKKTWERAE